MTTVQASDNSVTWQSNKQISYLWIPAHHWRCLFHKPFSRNLHHADSSSALWRQLFLSAGGGTEAAARSARLPPPEVEQVAMVGVLPLAAYRLDGARPADDERHAVPALPGVGLVPPQRAAGEVPCGSTSGR